MFELYEVIFETYIDSRLVKQQEILGPKALLIGTFLSMAKSIANDSRPMCIKMIRPVTIWDQFEQTHRVLNNEISLSNNAKGGQV
jgi:hypothetical protein